MSKRTRLDQLLVQRGLADSRARAKEMVEAGDVKVSGAIADNPARQVSNAEPLEVMAPPPRFVSRGGEKLVAALDRFAIDPTNLHVLDVGASTGGFTDALLQRGAREVVALDVGHGHLHEKLRRDPRVRVIERCNARHLTPGALGDKLFDLVVCDVSFISLRTLAPVLAGGLSGDDAMLIALIKPQFEAGRAEVSKGGGVIRSPAIWEKAIKDVVVAMAEEGAALMGVMASPLHGASGNTEFLGVFALHRGKARALEALESIELGDLVDSAATAVFGSREAENHPVSPTKKPRPRQND